MIEFLNKRVWLKAHCSYLFIIQHPYHLSVHAKVGLIVCSDALSLLLDNIAGLLM